jgi:anhydro-N-acetylmuramic acid kinase
MHVVGQMSGTSLDGIDFVWCRFKDAFNAEYLDHASVAFPQALRKRLIKAAQGELKVASLADLNFALGECYSKSLAQVATKRRWKIDLIGLHGQTIFHHAPHSTWQLGEPSFLRERFNVPVAFNFRVADVAAGGQGAPLAPIFHHFAFSQASTGIVAVQNLGGISNVTFLAKSKRRSQKSAHFGHIARKVSVRSAAPQTIDLSHVQAFDTGPANMLMDLAMQKISGGRITMDKNGALAACGVPNVNLVVKWLRHPFFTQRPPKSTGREQFGEKYFLKLWAEMVQAGVRRPEDKLATLLEFTAQSIAMNYQKFAPEPVGDVFLCGGGSRNSALVQRLRLLLAPADVRVSDELGWPHQAIEGAAFAQLAYLRFHNIALDISGITGAKGARVLGQMA